MHSQNWFVGQQDDKFVELIVLDVVIWTTDDQTTKSRQCANASSARRKWHEEIAHCQKRCQSTRLWRYDPIEPQLFQLETEISDGVSQILSDILTNENRLDRFALYSDSMAMTVCAAACVNDSMLEEEDLWCPQEWPLLSGTPLDIANRYLQSRTMRPWPNSVDADQWVKLAHETMVKALAHVAEVWCYATPKPVFLFEPSAGEMDQVTIERLNGIEVAREYGAAS